MSKLSSYYLSISQALDLGMPDMQAVAFSAWVVDQIVAVAVRNERIRIEHEITKISLMRTETLGEVGICDLILSALV